MTIARVAAAEPPALAVLRGPRDRLALQALPVQPAPGAAAEALAREVPVAREVPPARRAPRVQQEQPA